MSVGLKYLGLGHWADAKRLVDGRGLAQYREFQAIETSCIMI
jgi:hypothetical protein